MDRVAAILEQLQKSEVKQKKSGELLIEFERMRDQRSTTIVQSNSRYLDKREQRANSI